ncbi:butyrophilin subfamily 1 member A1-like [Pluvialis apricaria]
MGSRYQQVTTLHIIIFLQIIHSITGQYKIIPPDKPVIGVIGKGVILPCQLKVKIIPERLSVQWIFMGNSKNIDVTTYDGRNIYNPVHEDETYKGRTNFFQSEFNKGNVSLHLKNVMLSDKGKYTCSVFFENWYDEVVVDLDVAAKGDETSVFLDGHVGQGIGLSCKSQGWFPAPKVVWLNSKRQTRKEKVTTQTKSTSSGIFDVVSSMNLEPGSDKEVSCRVVNNLLNAVCESRVLISDVFFPSTSPWMTAFLVILFLNIAVLAAVGYKLNSKYFQLQQLIWQSSSTMQNTISGKPGAMQQRSETSSSQQDAEQAVDFYKHIRSDDYLAAEQKSTSILYHHPFPKYILFSIRLKRRNTFMSLKEIADGPTEPILSVLGHSYNKRSGKPPSPVGTAKLQKKIDQLQEENELLQMEKAQVQEEKAKLQKKIDELVREKKFLQIQRHKVDVTLDADMAHPRLEISEDGKSVKDTGAIRKVPSKEKRFDSHTFVLAKEGYTCGRHYWEVDVGTRRSWALGIAQESVARKGTVTLSPKNGFWVVGFADGREYWAYTDPWTRLSVSGKLQKIGIFLDIPAKKLSFYNVHKKVALYTFTVGGEGGIEQLDSHLAAS